MTDIPCLTRREFIQIGGVGVASFFLQPMLKAANVETKEQAQPRGSAEVVVLLFLQGGPSQLDTFDVKEGAWTPPDFAIQTVKPGVQMPMGTLPKLAARLDKFSIIRALESWEAEHARGTYYLQAGRIFSPARLYEVPSVGSVVAYESLAQRKQSDFLPPFVAMDMATASLVGPGLLPPGCSPMAIFSDAPSPFVIPECEKSDFERRKSLLRELDQHWREEDTHRGRIFSDLDHYYQSAYPLLDNPRAAQVFTVKPGEHLRYGGCALGDACVMTRNVIEADAGTKFVFIAHNGWDLHSGAYDRSRGGQYKQCAELDGALSMLLDDLEERKDAKGRRLIDKTLILSMGEFGRTPGELTMNKGRDHYRFASVALAAGGGVKGGRVLGATDEKGAKVIQPGWSRGRSIYPEDVLITLYSLMGIDWTKKITQTPSGRTFEYIENISPKGSMEFSEITELIV